MPKHKSNVMFQKGSLTKPIISYVLFQKKEIWNPMELLKDLTQEFLKDPKDLNKVTSLIQAMKPKVTVLCGS